MKNTILLLILGIISANLVSAQNDDNTLLLESPSKWYIEFNFLEVNQEFLLSLININGAAVTPNILQGFEIGYTPTPKLGFAVGLHKKSKLYVIEPSLVDLQYVSSGIEIAVGAEYYFVTRKYLHFGLDLDIIGSISRAYREITILGVNSKSDATVGRIGISPNIQLKIDLTKRMQIIFATGFDYGYLDAKGNLTVGDIDSELSNTGNYLDYYYINRLTLRTYF